MQTHVHLEAQLASALALTSPNEYRQCLLSYVRYLAREADESRLREVCENFLGPPTGMGDGGSCDPSNVAWDPLVLGMKKHKLLREDILPALASNRKVQRLLNEFMDLLSEYGSTETHVEQTNLVNRVLSSGNDMMCVDTATKDQNNTPSVPTDGDGLISPSGDQANSDSMHVDLVMLEKDQVKPVLASSEQMNSDVTMVGKVVIALPAKEPSLSSLPVLVKPPICPTRASVLKLAV